MRYRTKQIKQFQKYILAWFVKNKRDLPWRRTRDPYKILVSEVMAQQTQLSRVIPKYREWIKSFPTIQILAQATVRKVLTLWSGLGYNKRALHLQKTAQIIVNNYNGKFSQDEKVLQTFPGIGRYTARAILCFAFNKQIAIVDTNVRKVIITRFCANYPKIGEGEFSTTKKLKDSRQALVTMEEIQHIADQLLPKGYAYEWNQALMDYSSAVLKKEKVPIKKQSTFKDSDRYYRGQIIKLLIKQKNATFKEIYGCFQSLQTTEGKKKLETILKDLEKDLLIKSDHLNKLYQLP